MSWSIYAIGRPAAVAAEIEAQSARFTGNCKEEFDAAKPHLLGLVNENAQTGSMDLNFHNTLIVKLDASGSGSYMTVDGKPSKYAGSCSVKLENFYVKL